MTDGALVLVVEDEKELRRFIRAALNAHGYRLLEASSVGEAKMLATSHNPELVLLDLGLPDGDGLELLAMIREWSKMPVIVLSARGREDDKVLALDAGADDYLTKPFGTNELLARMRVALRHRSSEAAGNEAKVLVGGKVDRTVGWYVRPTLVQVTNPRHALMTEEIFGPVVSLFVYPDEQLAEAVKEVDQATPYALTGSIFARDAHSIVQLTSALRHAAGNFYINDKCTGAVVGQRPFGGSRGSGTNDKAGSMWNLLRWVSPRTIKETFVPPTSVGYPFMGAE